MSPEIQYPWLPHFRYSGNYITNGFFIDDLSNNVHHLVAVDALNQSQGFTDLSASWIGVNNTIQVTATNAPKPITRPDAPTIPDVHPEASEKSILNSGEIKVTIKLPDGNLDDSGNVPEYSFIEFSSKMHQIVMLLVKQLVTLLLISLIIWYLVTDSNILQQVKLLF